MEVGMNSARGRCLAGVAWSIVAAVLLIALAGCHRTPAEQAIRETIDKMQKAGNDHDVDALIAPLSDDFIGTEEQGENFDRKTFGRYVRLILMHESNIHASLGPVTVTLQGDDRATASFTAVLTGGTGLLPSDGQLEQIDTAWKLEGGTWKLLSAQWKQSGSNK
jgi:hypothetical protein